MPVTKSATQRYVFLDWLPVAGPAVIPRTVCNCQNVDITEFAATGFLGVFEQTQTKSYLNKWVQSIQYQLRNDGIFFFSIELKEVDDEVLTKKQTSSLSKLVAHGIKNRHGHRDLFHGSAAKLSGSYFLPIELEVDSPVDISKVEFLKITTKAKENALLLLRENFGKSLRFLMIERAKVRLNPAWSNYPAFIVLALLGVVLWPTYVSYFSDPEVSLFGSIMRMVFFPLACSYSLIKGYKQLFKFVAKHQSIEKIKGTVVSDDSAPFWQIALLGGREFVVLLYRWFFTVDSDSHKWFWRPAILVGTVVLMSLPSQFGIPFYKIYSPDLNWKQISNFDDWNLRVSANIVLLALLFLTYLEIFKKRNFVLKLLDYTIGVLHFGNVFTDILRVSKEFDTLEHQSFNDGQSALLALKQHELRKLHVGYLVGAVTVSALLLLNLFIVFRPQGI
jgi:hypothetical protein